MMEPEKLYRRVFVGVGILVALAGLIVLMPRLASRDLLGVDDFVEYWAAGRLNAAGGNPYDPKEMDPLEREVGLPADRTVVMMWNPPWALTLVMPFGIPPYPVARWCWLLLQCGVMVLSADLLWRYYGGSSEYRWLAWILALTFCPTLITLRMGQISPLILLGLAGFLHFERRQQGWLVGALLVLITFKPHLVYLVGIGLLLWLWTERRWTVLLGAVVTGAAATAIPLWFNPSVIAQYRYATAHHPPTDFIATTFGSLLRVCFGEEKKWLIWVPPLLGLCWFGTYYVLWRRQRRDWDWSAQMPLLLLVSFCTAAYGWLGDQVALLPALISLAIGVWRYRPWVRVVAGGVYVLLNLLLFGINLTFCGPIHELLHLWTAPALLAGYLAVRGGWRVAGDG